MTSMDSWFMIQQTYTKVKHTLGTFAQLVTFKSRAFTS